MLTVQNSFAQFEAHIIATVQHGWQQFSQIVTQQTDTTRSLYGDMTGTVCGPYKLHVLLCIGLTRRRFSASHTTSNGMDS